MRILIRTSKTARWARRIGSLALPLAVLPVFMHRERLIGSATFHLVEQAALVVAVLGAVISIIAFARLWQTGDRGWSKAAAGLAVSLICLAPFAYGLSLALRYPAVTDISTDPRDPLPLASGIAATPLSEDAADILARAFPNVRSRRYPLDAPRMFALVNQQVAGWGWDVRIRREPVSEFGVGQINAVVTTLLGWRDEVALAVRGDESGSIVDMRSVSLFRGTTDLGANGSRIEQFLTGLDTAVQLLLRDSPAAGPAEPEPEETPAEDTGGQG